VKIPGEKIKLKLLLTAYFWFLSFCEATRAKHTLDDEFLDPRPGRVSLAEAVDQGAVEELVMSP